MIQCLTEMWGICLYIPLMLKLLVERSRDESLMCITTPTSASLGVQFTNFIPLCHEIIHKIISRYITINYFFMNVCWYKYDTKKVVETLFHNLNERSKWTNPSGNEQTSQDPHNSNPCLPSYYTCSVLDPKHFLYHSLKNSKSNRTQ